MESDSKGCIEALLGYPAASCWEIDTICSDANSLASNFLSVCFYWVKREANTVAHELASSTSSLHSSLSCNASSLPPSLVEAWPLICLLLVCNESLVYQKKRNRKIKFYFLFNFLKILFISTFFIRLMSALIMQ